MKQKTSYVSTGIFVSMGIVLFGLTFYFLSSDENMFSGRVRVHSYFQDTEGLMFGSTVSFSGITIGNVKAITYDADRKALKVVYTIKESYIPFVKKDSEAQLKTQGALGDRFVYLSAGSAESPAIEAGEEITTKPSADIFAAVQEKINSIPDLAGISKKLETLLDFLNSEDGLKGNSRELRKTLVEVRTTVKSINAGNHTKKSLEKLDSIMTKIDSGKGTLGKLISDPSLYNKVSAFLGGGQSKSSYLKEMARKSIEKNEETSN
jgi:phospholipid/cholesterol/gamma-HCH transport system substrate-binding protein